MSESISHESLGSENAPDPDAANAGNRSRGDTVRYQLQP